MNTLQPIILPDLGTAQVKFSLWYVQVGDRVLAGDRVAEVLIPGATFDIAAPVSGVLKEKLAQPNDVLALGQVFGLIEE
jgi:pyruvate/2-oxoglutarate dehydrogenase complex dihydrolipoamide acyltransferase (E2) component